MGFTLPSAAPTFSTEKPKIKKGLYRLELVRISDPKLMKAFDGETENLKSYFNFKIVPGHQATNATVGTELSVCVRVDTLHEKSGFYGLLKALTNDAPELYAQADSDALIGLQCDAMVGDHTTEKGETYSKIKELSPLEDEEGEEARVKARNKAGIPLNTVFEKAAKPAVAAPSKPASKPAANNDDPPLF